MDPDERPHLHALVAWFSPTFGVLGDPLIWPKIMPLEDAVDYARAGAVVLVDPADECDLAIYECWRRALHGPKRRWYDAP